MPEVLFFYMFLFIKQLLLVLKVLLLLFAIMHKVISLFLFTQR